MPELQFTGNTAEVVFLTRCFYGWRSFLSASKYNMGATYPDGLENRFKNMSSNMIQCFVLFGNSTHWLRLDSAAFFPSYTYHCRKHPTSLLVKLLVSFN